MQSTDDGMDECSAKINQVYDYFFNQGQFFNRDEIPFDESFNNIIVCMFNLIALIDVKKLTALERVGVLAAKEYWLNKERDLAFLIATIKNKIFNQEFVSYTSDTTEKAEIARCVLCVVNLYDSADFTIYDGVESLLDALEALSVSDQQILNVVETYFKHKKGM